MPVCFLPGMIRQQKLIKAEYSALSAIEYQKPLPVRRLQKEAILPAYSNSCSIKTLGIQALEPGSFELVILIMHEKKLFVKHKFYAASYWPVIGQEELSRPGINSPRFCHTWIRKEFAP